MLSLSCLRQIDINLLIASSSVVHISLCIVGLLALSGAIVVIIGHGVCSSGLFYLANVVYERSHSRSMVVSNGFLTLISSICLWWFVILGVNIASPPSLNLLGEILLIITLVSWSNYIISVIMLLPFFSASYSLYLFSLSQHGVYLNSKSGFHSGDVSEYLVCVDTEFR